VGYIPPGARWYLADIVEEFKIEGEPNNVVHTNSPEHAWQRANEIGRQSVATYKNSDGKFVSVAFRGLRDLNVIHDKLVHGAELIYSRRVGMAEHELEKWVSPKEHLGVFRPIEALGDQD
jgi:Domain of unknown function (DUF4288)